MTAIGWKRRGPVSKPVKTGASDYDRFRRDWRKRPMIGDPMTVNDVPERAPGESLAVRKLPR